MTFAELRLKHPVFHYQAFHSELIGDRLRLTYDFLLEPNLTFHPVITLPFKPPLDLDIIKPLVFHLGLIESLSYWKCAISPLVRIEAGYLSPEQINWWHELFINGLGEFFYQNQIDYTQPDFLTLESVLPSNPAPIIQPQHLVGDLILVGGGKDSVVTLDCLSSLSTPKNVLLLNPTKAALATGRIAGYDHPLVVDRILDPKLLHLNQSGYINGHTPFSAYLAFLSELVAYIHGFSQVIVSNEASAGEGNLHYLDRDINHQYSKSYHFEALFRNYLKHYLIQDLPYFSFLRPLSELQIAALFSQKDLYDQAFCSCNRTKNDGWCGECAKCAFAYLVLSPFMSPDRLVSIFGQDLFSRPIIRSYILELVGLTRHKPFDCVGTIEESRQAVYLAQDTHQFLRSVAAKLPPPSLARLDQLTSVPHFIPTAYLKLLNQRLATL